MQLDKKIQISFGTFCTSFLKLALNIAKNYKMHKNWPNVSYQFQTKLGKSKLKLNQLRTENCNKPTLNFFTN